WGLPKSRRRYQGPAQTVNKPAHTAAISGQAFAHAAPGLLETLQRVGNCCHLGLRGSPGAPGWSPRWRPGTWPRMSPRRCPALAGPDAHRSARLVAGIALAAAAACTRVSDTSRFEPIS